MQQHRNHGTQCSSGVTGLPAERAELNQMAHRWQRPDHGVNLTVRPVTRLADLNLIAHSKDDGQGARLSARRLSRALAAMMTVARIRPRLATSLILGVSATL